MNLKAWFRIIWSVIAQPAKVESAIAQLAKT